MKKGTFFATWLLLKKVNFSKKLAEDLLFLGIFWSKRWRDVVGGWVGGGIIFTGTSLVVPKKVPAVYGDFDFFFLQKTPDFENSSLFFFHLQMFLKFFAKI